MTSPAISDWVDLIIQDTFKARTRRHMRQMYQLSSYPLPTSRGWYWVRTDYPDLQCFGVEPMEVRLEPAQGGLVVLVEREHGEGDYYFVSVADLDVLWGPRIADWDGGPLQPGWERLQEGEPDKA